jgi:hypothetical protein
LDALATRVGKSFWVKSVDGKSPLFLTAPAANAASFRAEDNQSFEIVELTGRANKNPYYKVKFSSGKEAYIRPEAFYDEFNVTIVTVDPLADEKRHADEMAKEEKARIEWIQAQPWSPAVKQASIKKQPIPGLTTAEIKRVIGSPSRITKTHGPLKVAEERWYFSNGLVLTFHNGLLAIIDQQEKK